MKSKCTARLLVIKRKEKKKLANYLNKLESKNYGFYFSRSTVTHRNGLVNFIGLRRIEASTLTLPYYQKFYKFSNDLLLTQKNILRERFHLLSTTLVF